jgi:hypothetical protein
MAVGKKKASSKIVCEHPYKKRVKISYGIEDCSVCGVNVTPERITTYQLSERVNLTAGELVKVKGIGVGVFLYATAEPSGDALTVAELESGRWRGIRTVYPDRVSRAAKKVSKR